MKNPKYHFDMVADQIIAACGLGNMLDINAGEGGLVASLLRRGINAYGVDASEPCVSIANQYIPEHFKVGTPLSLPFEDEAFHTIVANYCMEELTPVEIPSALKEIYRVASRYVFVLLATKTVVTQESSILMNRAWWETQCFEMGFRKSANYYKINAYEALNHDGEYIYILLEKIPPNALKDYPLTSLKEERNLHMDMLRETGERSDAHVIRYYWACNYIKPGDHVLDAACGLGYGAWTIKQLTYASKIVGIDGSQYAIDYARKSFIDKKVEYNLGLLPDVLSEYPDGSFDTIVSFETLEHVEDPEALLKTFFRLLAPGGRVIVSVPNDWSDESGKDPNPYHLHVYNHDKLKSQLNAHFILEHAFAQTATQCKAIDQNNVWVRRPRALIQTDLNTVSPTECEWWLMVAMKSPLDAKQPYRERLFHNLKETTHHSMQYESYYENPWIMPALVNLTHRMKNNDHLMQLSDHVIENADSCSNDYAAALCVRAYGDLYGKKDADTINQLLLTINLFLKKEIPDSNPMQLRWKISILFVKGKLLQIIGKTQEAIDTLVECGQHDVRPFGIHLATKTTEAWYTAGRLAYALNRLEDAKQFWLSGLEQGKILLTTPMDDILINPSFPNRFHHGDGIREYILAWDNVARCANGIYLTHMDDYVDSWALDACNQSEFNKVNHYFHHTQDALTAKIHEIQRLVSEKRELEARHEELKSKLADLLS